MQPTRWGQAIQRLLLARGWTQKRLAASARIRPNTLTNIIKHGRHTDTETLSRIALALDVDLSELFLNQEQIDVLKLHRRDRVDRIAERVMAELTATVTRVVREDFQRMLSEQPPGSIPHHPRRR